jgi:tRNA-splicing ligase RtcB
MNKPIKIFGESIIDEKTIKQLENCMTDTSIGVLTADAHFGYSHPIGGAIAYKDMLSVSGVGFDIACGNKAVRTNIKATDIDISKIMDEIFKRVSFGVGRPNNEPVDHDVFDLISQSYFKPQRKLIDVARNQLGTVGSGNHFVNLMVDQDGLLWIAVHFGSRGFGHKTATGFLAMAQGLTFTDKGKEGLMDAKPVLLDINSEMGYNYYMAMIVAGEYAYAGRDTVVNKVLEILGNPEVTFNVHNHHNFAWLENHFDEEYIVTRKGCTPAFPGQYGFIGANMRDTSFIIRGVDSDTSKEGLYSTVHGAGRVMSRTAAAGKVKWMRADANSPKRPVTVTKGSVDFEKVKTNMSNHDVILRGAGADEAPECYKSLNQVLQYQGLDETISIVHALRPIGVAMAGDDFDPYKD